MGIFSNFINKVAKKPSEYNLNTVFTHTNGREMQQYILNEAKPILDDIVIRFKDLKGRTLINQFEYPVQLTETQAMATMKIVEHKREGKFALANHEYIELIKQGPISWALLSSWAKVLLCVTLLPEATVALTFSQLIIEKNGNYDPYTRSASMLRVLITENWQLIRHLIIDNSGIENFEPLEYKR